MTTHYNTLGVAEDASEADITYAYRTLIRKTHPDLHPDGAAVAGAVNEAFDVLRDPVRRRDYDRTLAPATSTPVVEPPPGRARWPAAPPQRTTSAPASPASPRAGEWSEPADRPLPHARTHVISASVSAASVGGGGTVMAVSALGSTSTPESGWAPAAAVFLAGALAHLIGVRRWRLLALPAGGPALWAATLVPGWPIADRFPEWFLVADAVASVGVVTLARSMIAWRRHRKALRGARAWARAATNAARIRGAAMYFVAAVDPGGAGGRFTVLAKPLEPGEDEQVNLSLWSAPRPGTWVTVNRAGQVLDTVDDADAAAWLRFREADEATAASS